MISERGVAITMSQVYHRVHDSIFLHASFSQGKYN